MPEIARFFGIVTFFRSSDHPPPHFHARYQGRVVSVDIRTLRVRGKWNARAAGLLVEWASLHQEELLRAWNAHRRGDVFEPIDPLE